MIDLLVRSLALAALGLLALLAARRRSASVRHLVSLAALASLLALPLFGRLVPPARLPVLPRPPVETTVVPAAVTYETVQTVTPSTPVSEPAPTPRPFPWALLWPLGTGVLLLRWGAGWAWLTLRLRKAERIGPEPLSLPGERGRGEGPQDGSASRWSGNVPVVESDAFAFPLVAWTPRARIVLPRGWREWPAERLDVVLRHEAAHVRRGDGLGMLVARLAVALFWPNPLAWTLARAEARLAERATDDLVVSEGVPAVRYAHELLALARKVPAPTALPALGMARPAGLSQRVEMILKPSLPRNPVAPRARLGAALAALALALPVAVFALGQKAVAMPNVPDFSVRVVPHRETVAFLLRCKIVRSSRPGTIYSNDSALEPQIGQSDPSRVAVAPRVYAPNHGTVDLKVSVGGKDLTVQLTPDSVDDARWSLSDPRGSRMVRLRAVTTTPIRKGVRDYNVWNYTLHANGWGLYTLMDAKGDGTGYQMLVQVTPYGNEGPTTEAPLKPKSPEIRPMQPRAVPLPPVERPTVPQAIPPAKVAQQKGTLVGHKAPQEFLLKCKFLRTPSPGGRWVTTSSTEPKISRSLGTSLITAPVLRDVAGEDAWASAAIASVTFKVKMRPRALAVGRWAVDTTCIVREKGVDREDSLSLPTLRGGEWIQLPLPSPDGDAHGYQMLIQLVPIAVDQ